MPSLSVFSQVDPLYLAASKLRRRHYDECIDICTKILVKNPLDKAVWFMKCRALTLKTWVDDTDMEEEGVGDLLLDENAVHSMPRPGTSLSHRKTGTHETSGTSNQSIRPLTASGRPVSGFIRPGMSTRHVNNGGTLSVKDAFRGNRPGTSRPVTSLGRQIRLATASIAQSDPNGQFVNVNCSICPTKYRLDLQKYASRPNMARVLVDYIRLHYEC
eukprot:GSMAST32.ASY1.ANO1.1325.1 assembled CDS